MVSSQPGASRSSTLWHLFALLAVSSVYESLFLHHGLNRLDEGWPLYAAMQLHAGGSLYRDVLWVFPPGHVWMAWLGFALEPPGIVPTRILYAAFNVALCAAMYLLGRRIMPAPFALLGCVLLAVAAPRGHLGHLLFGYRYLVFSVLALLAFSQRLRSGDARWLLGSGLCAGAAVVFRLTPAFAVSCAVALAVVAASRDWRCWLKDWAWYALGVLAVLAPVMSWFGHGVGLDVLWLEVVERPLAMLQAQPWPALCFPDFDSRRAIRRCFLGLLQP